MRCLENVYITQSWVTTSHNISGKYSAFSAPRTVMVRCILHIFASHSKFGFPLLNFNIVVLCVVESMVSSGFSVLTHEQKIGSSEL